MPLQADVYGNITNYIDVVPTHDAKVRGPIQLTAESRGASSHFVRATSPEVANVGWPVGGHGIIGAGAPSREGLEECDGRAG